MAAVKARSDAQQPGGGQGAGATAAAEPRFIADMNVGRLARWLRILGYDTLFVNPIDDDQLVTIGLDEGRIVLTKDTHIAKRRVATSGQVRVLIVEGDRVADQLRFVARRLGLEGPTHLLSRCIECNVLLRSAEPAELEGRVPPYVWQTQKQYSVCPTCGRIYWAGTHWSRMHHTAMQVLGDRR